MWWTVSAMRLASKLVSPQPLLAVPTPSKRVRNVLCNR